MYNGKEVSLCIPVFRRYDLLNELIESAEQGTVIPDKYIIMDNGGLITKTHFEISGADSPKIFIKKPGINIGVAAAWNWFIRNVKEERLISNDDILLAKDSVEKLVSAEGDFIQNEATGFCIFNYRDSLVEKVGLFNEVFYPAYFDDDDMRQRMKLAGVTQTNIQSNIKHAVSATLKVFTPKEMEEHHNNFRKLRSIYTAMWGGGPHEEKFTIPYGRIDE